MTVELRQLQGNRYRKQDFTLLKNVVDDYEQQENRIKLYIYIQNKKKKFFKKSFLLKRFQ